LETAAGTWWRRLAFTAVLVLLAVGPPFFPPFLLTLMTQTLIYAIVAMSLDLILGYTGLSSLGHAAYLGLGAYSVGILATQYRAGFWTTLLVGIVLAAVVAAIFGLVALRATGVYFLMITLALGMVLWGLGYRWIPVTGGDNGISGIPSLEAHAGLPVGGPVAFYYVAFVIFLACGTIMALLVGSPFGFTLRGIRENESRMKSLGFNTWLHCYISYVVAGTFASVAGVMWAYYNGFVSPTYLDLTASSELFLMVTLGGPGTLVGPVFGAGAIVLLKNVISGVTERWLFILGAVYIITILAAPQGLWNLGRRSGAPPKQRRTEVAAFLVASVSLGFAGSS
jgi:branched-chain amino acid transport system permease protein